MSCSKTAIPLVAALLTAGTLSAEPVVTAERGDNTSEWTFPTIPRPSRSDIARKAKITIVGNEPARSCLSPDGLRNGVLPWEGKQARDFFFFSNTNTRDGKIVMDLGTVQPVAAVAAYSWQGSYPFSLESPCYTGGPYKTNKDGVNGARAPQVYTLYGSAAASPDPARLHSGDWVKLADVDTRPNRTGENWQGKYASFVRDSKGGLLGKFRWLVWDVKRTLKPQQYPEWTGTWYVELDVHTPETLKQAGDAVMAGTGLEKIVLSFKTHFDIGFTHRAPAIVDIYRTSMIDHALDIIDESRKLPADQRFAWTIPSWVMWQILWPGQDPVRRERIIRAAREGSLVVHAMPVSLHTESLDLEDLVFGLSLNAKVAGELGVPLARAGKMTDVPSHSWVMPSLLKNAGIDFLHIGCSTAIQRPEVPMLYYWEGPDGSRLLTMHMQGYGSDHENGKGLYPPKDWPYKNWLAMIMTGDNEGPPTKKHVMSVLDELKHHLPAVKVQLGKMEDFADDIVAEEKAGAKIPLVRADLPDVWIQGTGTMPVQNALASKTRMELIAAESLNTHLRVWGLPSPDIRSQVFTAHERSLMYGEHTWGGDANLQGRNAFDDKDFAKTIRTDAVCKHLQAEWDDHAAYIEQSAAITDKLLADQLRVLAAHVNLEGDRLVVFNPLPYPRDALVEIPGKPGERILVKDLPPSGYRAVLLKQDAADMPDRAAQADQAVLENPFLKVTLDRAKGGIISIVDKTTGREMVDPKAKYAFGQYLYQRFDLKQLHAFDAGIEYIDSIFGFIDGWTIRADIPAGVPYAEAVPSYTRMTVRKNGLAQTCELFAEPAGIVAAKVTTVITLPENAPWLEIGIRLDDKKPDYWPENGGFYLPVNARNPQFRLGRLGGIVNPVTDYARGCNRTYGYAPNGAMIADTDGQGVAICPLDQGLMSFGEKGIGTLDPDYVPQTPLARVSMFNNFWTVNFPYWIQGSFQSRVRVWATHDLKASSLIEPALEARQPVLAVVATGPSGSLPATMGGLSLSRPGIRLVQFAANPDNDEVCRRDALVAPDNGKAAGRRFYGEESWVLLRVWEQAGTSGELTVTLPVGATFTSATPVSLRGEETGNPLAITNSKFIFSLGKFAPASFILK